MIFFYKALFSHAWMLTIINEVTEAGFERLIGEEVFYCAGV